HRDPSRGREGPASPPPVTLLPTFLLLPPRVQVGFHLVRHHLEQLLQLSHGGLLLGARLGPASRARGRSTDGCPCSVLRPRTRSRTGRAGRGLLVGVA